MFLQPPVHARTHDVLVTAYRNLGRRKKPHGECEDQPMALREKGSGEDVGWYQPKRSLLLGGAQRAPALGSRDSKTGPEHLHEIRNRIISTRSVKGMRRAHEQSFQQLKQQAKEDFGLLKSAHEEELAAHKAQIAQKEAFIQPSMFN